MCSGITRIAFGEDQESASAAAVQKDESKFYRVLKRPTFADQSIDGGGHGIAQIAGALQGLAFYDLPLQIEENQISRGVGAGEDVVLVAGHRESVANRGSSVYPVVSRARNCMGSIGLPPVQDKAPTNRCGLRGSGVDLKQRFASPHRRSKGGRLGK